MEATASSTMEAQQPPFEAVDLTDDDPFVALPVEHLLQQVTDVFPDICPVHLNKLAEDKFHIPESIINAVLQDLENGVPYPKRSVLGKRKRQTDPILESLAKSDDDFGKTDVKRLNEYFTGPLWKQHIAKIKNYRKLCVDYLASRVFHSVTKKAVKAIFDQHRDATLFQIYWVMGQHDYREKTPGWEHPHRNWKPVESDNLEVEPAPDGDPVNLCKELYAARRIAAFNGRGVLEEKKEAVNRERAEADGLMRECGCCFSDEPVNRMVCCDVNPEHLFCYACARKHAETQLGLSKYELKCLSMDDCPGDFYVAERRSYLDGKTIAALDRHEQEAALREANIENLASCPFCPYAAVCPPVEQDKEFRCMNPECRVVSCRSCNRETHIPKTCAEALADNTNLARHEIEEAMSAAMIRKCNKCSTPFVKVSGCNKMTCSKAGCRNQQCYLCGKSCGYNHFTQTAQTGCVLHDGEWDGVEGLHRKEVETAQEAARKRLLEENPDMTEEELRIRLPEDAATGNKNQAAAPGPRHQHRPPQAYPANAFVARPVHGVGVQIMAPPLLPWGGAPQIGQGAPQQYGQPFQFPPAQQRNQAQPAPRQGQPPQVPQAGLPQYRQLYQQPFQFAPAQQPSQAQLAAGQGAQPPGQHPAMGQTPLQSLEQRRALLEGQVRDALAAMHTPEALGRTQAPPAINRPGASAPGQRYSANGAAMPKGGAAPSSPEDEMMKGAVNEMRQAPSQHSLDVRLAIANALRPYVDEIAQQVGNHIRAAWLGIMLPQMAEAMARPARKEIWKGVPKLVDRELEEIDRTVRSTHWEKLYNAMAVPQGQLRHYGEILPPETADEYVSMHAIIRSCDRAAPPHHTEMARQAHANVMATLGQQQPPPRVAPLHHHGSPEGQRLQNQRIQKYLAARGARVTNDQAKGITRKAPAGATNGTARGHGSPRLIPVPDDREFAAGVGGASQPSTPVRPPRNTSGNGQGPASQPLRRSTRPGAQTATPASSAGMGTRDTPIVIDDADPVGEATNKSSSRGGALPYRVIGALAMGLRGGGEPPTKRGRA